MRKKEVNEELKVRGFFRINVVDPDGRIVGDSKWQKNRTVNEGIRDYLVYTMLASAGSRQVSHLALGSGGVPAEADAVLAGEVEVRKGVTKSVIASKTAQFTAQFVSADSFVTNTQSISNVGLFNTSTQGSTGLMAGQTYASSTVATNQAVNVTYQIRFSTT